MAMHTRTAFIVLIAHDVQHKPYTVPWTTHRCRLLFLTTHPPLAV